MAYKLKKKTNGRIVIKNIEFSKGKVVEVTKNVFDYIMKTFKDMFDVVAQEVAKPATKIPNKSKAQPNTQGSKKPNSKTE